MRPRLRRASVRAAAAAAASVAHRASSLVWCFSVLVRSPSVAPPVSLMHIHIFFFFRKKRGGVEERRNKGRVARGQRVADRMSSSSSLSFLPDGTVVRTYHDTAARASCPGTSTRAASPARGATAASSRWRSARRAAPRPRTSGARAPSASRRARRRLRRRVRRRARHRVAVRDAARRARRRLRAARRRTLRLPRAARRLCGARRRARLAHRGDGAAPGPGRRARRRPRLEVSATGTRSCGCAAGGARGRVTPRGRVPREPRAHRRSHTMPASAATIAPSSIMMMSGAVRSSIHRS